MSLYDAPHRAGMSHICTFVCVSFGSVCIAIFSCEQSLVALTQFHFSSTKALDKGGTFAGERQKNGEELSLFAICEIQSSFQGN